MLIVTTSEIAGKSIRTTIGLVRGNTIQSKHIGRDIGAGLKTLIGGEITGYTEMLTEAREIALERMVEDAKRQGANAVVNLRFSTSQVMQGAAEILAYGTAVIIE